MKISLALGPRRPLSRQTAWGCLTTNLALPGSGSLVAGRISGYIQVALTLAGFALTFIFGLRFIVWYLTNWTRLQDPEGDLVGKVQEVWLMLRWALLGIGVFMFSWLWALLTSFQILRSAQKNAGPTPPPHLS